MSEARKGKKRPKSYYIKCAKGKRQKRINDLDVGMKGFLITCNTHEKEAVRESYNILNEYADKLYGPEVGSLFSAFTLMFFIWVSSQENLSLGFATR